VPSTPTRRSLHVRSRLKLANITRFVIGGIGAHTSITWSCDVDSCMRLYSCCDRFRPQKTSGSQATPAHSHTPSPTNLHHQTATHATCSTHSTESTRYPGRIGSGRGRSGCGGRVAVCKSSGIVGLSSSDIPSHLRIQARGLAWPDRIGSGLFWLRWECGCMQELRDCGVVLVRYTFTSSHSSSWP
jgi:hypothetical protein